MLTCLVPVLFIFYIQGVLKLKKNSGAKELILTETRYQLRLRDKELHTEHTPLRTIISHQRYPLHLYRTKRPMW